VTVQPRGAVRPALRRRSRTVRRRAPGPATVRPAGAHRAAGTPGGPALLIVGLVVAPAVTRLCRMLDGALAENALPALHGARRGLPVSPSPARGHDARRHEPRRRVVRDGIEPPTLRFSVGSGGFRGGPSLSVFPGQATLPYSAHVHEQSRIGATGTQVGTQIGPPGGGASGSDAVAHVAAAPRPEAGRSHPPPPIGCPGWACTEPAEGSSAASHQLRDDVDGPPERATPSGSLRERGAWCLTLEVFDRVAGAARVQLPSDELKNELRR